MISRLSFLVLGVAALVGCATTAGPAPVAPAATAAAQPATEGRPTPPPAATTSPAPTMAPATPAESSPIPSDAPPPVVEVTVAAITFGRDRTLGSDTVSIVDRGSEFAGGREIAWRVELPPAAGNELIRVTVEEIASGAITVDESFTPEAGWNVFYGKTVLADQPGTYVMRYFVDGIVLGEGQFTIREAVVDAATPRPDAPDRTPKPQPRPTPKPDRTPEPPPEPDRDCDPSYPTLCLRSSPDLDCPEINARNFPVRGRDPHGFDGDGDGVGCES